MPLTPDQMEKFQSWIREKDIDTNCPACGNDSWVSSEIIAPPIRSRTKPSEDGLQMPLVELMCDNCGFIRLFSAVKTGLL